MAETYKNGYFDIQDILASQERITCKFDIDISNMGYLDSSSHDANLKAGAKLDLPYWLIKAIHNEKFKFVSITLPKPYNKFHSEILEADACVVDLRKMGPHYYDFGILLVNLFDIDQGLNIARTLQWCFRNRFRRIMDYSCQIDHRDLHKAISKFDTTEMEIFRAGQRDSEGFVKWQKGEFCRRTASAIITAHKKRKKRTNSETE